MDYETVQPNEVSQKQTAAQFWEVIQPNGVLRALAREQFWGVMVKMVLAVLIMYLLNWPFAIYWFFELTLPAIMPAEMPAALSAVDTAMSAVGFVISGAFALGFAGYCLKCIRNQAVKVKNIFDGFKRFIHSFLLMFFTTLFAFLWSLLLIVPGIIKWLGYSMAFNIMYDNPDVKPLEALRKSQIMMKGYKWKLFKLVLSFVGFALVGVVILSRIGKIISRSLAALDDVGHAILILLLTLMFALWLYSFIGLSMANFYENLKRVREKAGTSDVNLNDETACAADFAMQNYKRGNDKPSLLPKALMFTMIIIIYATTVFAQIPDIKWYTAKQKAKNYEISTADELAGLAALVNGTAALETEINRHGSSDLIDEMNFRGVDFKGRTIRLARDIDVSKYCHNSKFNNGNGWTPIGHCVIDERGECSDEGFSNFSGTFDGNGKTISGLYSQGSEGSDNEGRVEYIPGGVFGSVSGTVKNLGVVEAKVNSSGGIVGMLRNGGKVANCYFTGTVSGNVWSSGYTGEVYGDIVGGIVGWVQNGNVSNSYFTGTASGRASAGGIVGVVGNAGSKGMWGKGGNVSNCYSAGTINGEAGVGGIVGTLGGIDSKVSNCYSIATVNGTSSVGGIAGFVDNLALTAVYSNIRMFHADCGNGPSCDSYSFSMYCAEIGPCPPDELSIGHAEFGRGMFGEKFFYKQIENITLFDTLKNGVSNSIALNPSVRAKGSEKSIPLVAVPEWEIDALGFGLNRAIDSSFSRGGRVIGGSDAGKFSNNAAFRGIANISGNTSWGGGKKTTSINGQDITASAIKSDGTLGGRFTAQNGWVIQDGKLPGFGAAVDMPEHLK